MDNIISKENIRKGALRVSAIMLLGMLYWSMTGGVKPKEEENAHHPYKAFILEINDKIIIYTEGVPDPSDSTKRFNEMEIVYGNTRTTLRDSTDVVSLPLKKKARIEDIELSIDDRLIGVLNRSKDTTENARAEFDTCNAVYNNILRILSNAQQETPPERLNLPDYSRI